MDGGGGETGAPRPARFFLERRGALPGETLGRSLHGVPESRRARRGGRCAAAIIFAPSRAARSPFGRNAITSARVEKDRIPGGAPRSHRAAATDAGSRTALGRADRALDDPGAGRSAGANRARHFRYAPGHSSVQTLRLF